MLLSCYVFRVLTVRIGIQYITQIILSIHYMYARVHHETMVENKMFDGTLLGV